MVINNSFKVIMIILTKCPYDMSAFSLALQMNEDIFSTLLNNDLLYSVDCNETSSPEIFISLKVHYKY